MAVLDPVKLVITNYPEGKEEWLDAENNQEDEVHKKKYLFKRLCLLKEKTFLEDALLNF
jgi:glutaminyl-tRNA synthetase